MLYYVITARCDRRNDKELLTSFTERIGSDVWMPPGQPYSRCADCR